MRVQVSELRKIIREALTETRPGGRAIGAEWDEPEKKNELDETDGWFDSVVSKAKKLAMTDVGGPEGFLSPSDKATRHGKTKTGPSDEFKKWQEKRNKKQEVSETGAYYGKVAPARGAIMGGNDQKDPAMVCSCGDPGCPGCEEDGNINEEDSMPSDIKNLESMAKTDNDALWVLYDVLLEKNLDVRTILNRLIRVVLDDIVDYRPMQDGTFYIDVPGEYSQPADRAVWDSKFVKNIFNALEKLNFRGNFYFQNRLYKMSSNSFPNDNISFRLLKIPTLDSDDDFPQQLLMSFE